MTFKSISKNIYEGKKKDIIKEVEVNIKYTYSCMRCQSFIYSTIEIKEHDKFCNHNCFFKFVKQIFSLYDEDELNLISERLLNLKGGSLNNITKAYGDLLLTGNEIKIFIGVKE